MNDKEKNRKEAEKRLMPITNLLLEAGMVRSLKEAKDLIRTAADTGSQLARDKKNVKLPILKKGGDKGNKA